MKAFLYICFGTLASLWFAYQTTSHITTDKIIYDAKTNVRIAYHLVHTGVYSNNKTETSDPKPTMKREPLPILAISAYLLLHPSFVDAYTLADLLDGRLTRTVKLVNAFWVFIAALFIFLLCLELFRSPLAAGMAALITLAVSDATFLSTPPVIDRLFTELPASALLLAASWSAVRFVNDETKSRAICLGIAMGLLALTKAAFLYIGIVFILLLFLFDRLALLRQHAVPSLRQLLANYAMLVFVFLATLAPWMIRNTISMGTPAIATRAEPILGMRMILSEFPPLGLIYATSPPSVREHLGPLLGYSAQDLEVGKLNDIGHVNRRRGEIFRERMRTEGYEGKTDQWLRHAFLASVLSHPLGYALSLGVFAYRGMWFMQPSGVAERLDPVTFYALSTIALLIFLGVFFAGLIASKKILVAAFGLSAGAFAFHSALTHAIPRYNKPITPLVIIAVLWSCGAVARRLTERKSEAAINERGQTSESLPRVPM